MSEAEYDRAEPRAEAMIHSLRAFGYDLGAAVADLIDNSIAAGARDIRLEFLWDGAASTFSITDDGRGMGEAELVEAMRPGCRSPLEERDPTDLGRFGLGLKTASFSQCRKLTVGSKRSGGNVAARCWDLGYVQACCDWRLLRVRSSAFAERAAKLNGQASGTVVLWEDMDRVVGGASVASKADHDLFLERVDGVFRHVAMVFHRFLQRPNAPSISINGRPVAAWDPYLTGEPATQLLTAEALRIFGKRLKVSPYVLPHHSRLDPETHARAGGPRGWTAQQGFYVYRNDRMLVAGDWLGLGMRKEEHYRLARIMLEIPNSMDAEWELDVKKSVARPPAALRPSLKRIASLTCARAAEVYRHRGKLLARSASRDYVYMWLRKARKDTTSYSINREHPLVRELLRLPGARGKLGALLRLVEETVPVPMIAIDQAEQPDKHSEPFQHVASREIRELMGEVYRSLRASGSSPAEAKGTLVRMEPFDRYPDLVAGIADD